MVDKPSNDNESEEPYTLRSEFARRTSHFKSVTDSSREEVADIEETLRVIDSARRFLHNSSKDSSMVTPTPQDGHLSVHITGPLLARDMSKETLK